MKQTGWRLAVKQLVDRTAAAGGLLVTAPILAVAATAVRVSMGSPVLFRQQRPGLHAKPFELLKFRTMSDERDAQGKLLPDDRRLTRVGSVLRSTSMDELPQLWNVLRGELSLVGPRPLLMQYLERYTREQARRHEVMPGVTGWTQVNGRNALSWDEKFRLDVWYVDHWSLMLDLRILLRTVSTVLGRSGIAQEGQVTMPEFWGSAPRKPVEPLSAN